jgi:hypothetical protein
MLLDATNRSLELVLTAAQTTAAMNVTVVYVDETTTALPAAGLTPTNSNGVTAVTILASPAASTRRNVKNITIYNADSAAKTVKISLNVATVLYTIIQPTLQVGESLCYSDTKGWYVLTPAGTEKVGQAIAAEITNTPAGTISAVTVQSAINELDTEKMSLATYDSDGDGVVDSAEAIEIYVRNVTGTTITKGQVVYINGAVGQVATIALAKADAEITSSKTIGVVSTDIANNANGYAIRHGRLQNFNTSAFVDGDALWLSGTVAGALTVTKPTAPIHIVFMGIVSYAHITQGSLAVSVQNGFEINELHNVLITSVADKNALQYDTASTLWKNVTERAPVAGSASQVFSVAQNTAAAHAIRSAQDVTAWTRSATTTLNASLNGTLSDTSTTITAFNGVAGVTYHVRCLGAGSITYHATDLIITQGLASITTAAGDTFDVEMLTATTCRVKNYIYANQSLSFTPVLTDAATGGNVATTSGSIGRTYKIGKRRFIDIILNNINTTGLTSTNGIYIQGLPEIATAVTGYITIGAVMGNALASTTGDIQALLLAGESVLRLQNSTTSGNTTLVVSTITSGTTDIWCNINYETP